MSTSLIDEEPKQGVDYNVAMRRLAYMAALGGAVVLIYSLRMPTKFSEVVSVGLMAGGAALLTGGLLGFLFGVPHTRDDESTTNAEVPHDGSGASPALGTRSSQPRYRHNTSLEQISDWLTKILVGVGLIEIKSISENLWVMATALRKGFGGPEGSEAFALTLLIYFFACGFIFGFLWARLYLLRWFRQVDEIQALGKKVNQLERRQMADARALALIDQQLNRTSPDDPEATEQDIAKAIRAASLPVKTQIFNQAQKASENSTAEHYYELKIPALISIFKGFIASDVNEEDHNARAELSLALSRKKPADIEAAEEQLSKAIEIRDKRRLKGWKYYEMRRARYRIVQDEDFKKGAPSANATLVEAILSDLTAAHSEPEKWKRWLDSEKRTKEWLKLNANEQRVQEWLKVNAIDLDTLEQTVR